MYVCTCMCVNHIKNIYKERILKHDVLTADVQYNAAGSAGPVVTFDSLCPSALFSAGVSLSTGATVAQVQGQAVKE